MGAAGACGPAAPAPSTREALATAVSTTLPFEARLSGGFAPSKVGPTRAAGDRAPELSPDTRIAIALLEKRAIEDPTPAALADLGVGYLVQGDVDRAITTIEDAASQDTNAAPCSDLSAAYLAKAERTPERRVEYLARALEAAERSLKISKSNDALFNRALARHGLAPVTGSPAPWAEYSSGETDPAWRDAASRLAGDDRPVDDVRDRWEARRQELPAKLEAGDEDFARETARGFPEASIDFLDRELFTQRDALASAAVLASAIDEVTGDPMTRHEVAALRSHGPVLAAAHQSYAKSVSQYASNDLAGARASLTDAFRLFSRVDAPYRFWAEMRLTEIDWREGAFDAAIGRVSRVATEARTRGYLVLLARALSQLGQAYNRQWRLDEGLAALRESASRFESSGLRESATFVHGNLADALRMLGEAHESWEFVGRTLENLRHVRSANRRYVLLYNASLFASQQRLYEAALLFQDATVREASKAGTDVLTEALVQRALIHVHRGDDTQARADLDQAGRQASSTPSMAFRAYIDAELAIVRAQLDGNTAAPLENAIAFFSRREPGRLPGLYLLLARTSQARASLGTEAALRSGIERLEAQQSGLADEALKISFFDGSWSLFQDMVSLQLAAGKRDQAFEYAERSRARSLLASTQRAAVSRTRSLSEVQSQIPNSVVMLYYATLSDRVLIWSMTAAGQAFVESPVAERGLMRLIERHRAAIREHRDDRDANDRLHKLLIAPVAQALSSNAVTVLVPDGQLQQLPFATLRHPSSRHYLIEDYALMVSPSASFFLDARMAAGERSRRPITSALLVGNPAAAGTRTLPGAAAEVEMASKLYPRHTTLVGRTATRERFVEMAPAFEVVHFGGHAFANPEFPLLSRLVFADAAAGEQSLFAHDIMRLRFPRTRVMVLAACSTAAGAVSRGEGVVSVARPFLSGGVPLVVASQWDVDDRATGQLTLAFHRELAKTGDPIHALQAAQLALLRSGDAVQALPESWGAFVAVGTAAP